MPEPRKPSPQSAMLGTLVTEAGLLLNTLVTGWLTARLLLPEGHAALAAIRYWPQVVPGIDLLRVSNRRSDRCRARRRVVWLQSNPVVRDRA